MIRKLKGAIVADGVGHNYLIQHTTGSGKSNSIAWLAHLLTHLYRSPTDTNRIFDSVIVVTDRRVLDKQLQGHDQAGGNRLMAWCTPLMQPPHNSGVILNPAKTSSSRRFRSFSVIAEEIGKLKSKTFAVIIDEAHSSQSGESARNLRASLSQGIEGEVTEDDADEVSDIDAQILEEMERRRMQDHISYFGFSGTPKNKTLELFGRKDEEGKFVPFHVYSMHQSISEGFTLDVLQNYTTFKRYFELVKSVPEDKEYEKARTLRALTNYVDLQPHSIEDQDPDYPRTFHRTGPQRRSKGKGGRCWLRRPACTASDTSWNSIDRCGR